MSAASGEFDGFDPDNIDMGAFLRKLIARRIAGHERSQQTQIGASEIGTPCDRKLALKILETPAVPGQDDPEDSWRATVGVAVHGWLASMMEAENARYGDEAENIPRGKLCHPWCSENEHRDRYLVEYSVPVGTINGKMIPGNLDVYDRLSRTMIDWKIVGPTALKNYKRAKDPGEQYETQVQIYGRGIKRMAREDVSYVGIMFLPSNGELRDAYYWEDDFNPEIGKKAFERAREIASLLKREGRGIIPTLDTVDDHCSHCPFFAPGSVNGEYECGGDPSLTEGMEEETFGDLLPGGSIGR